MAGRARTQTHGVELFGDLPFMVDGDSADVWARQDQFRSRRLGRRAARRVQRHRAGLGHAGLSVGRRSAREDFRWLRERARRSADLFDGYRVDHLVGFYRTYGRPQNGGEPFFTPARRAAQLALGERLLGIFRGAGAEIIAEDLGTVPDFVRASLARLGVPGFRVFRWERHWHARRAAVPRSGGLPAVSVAASGTHDTEPLAVWWEHAPEDERRKVSALPTIQRLAGGRIDLVTRRYDRRVRDVLLEALFASGSNLLLLPVQDVFGWRDRINEPATVTRRQLDVPPAVAESIELDEIPEARERQETAARLGGDSTDGSRQSQKAGVRRSRLAGGRAEAGLRLRTATATADSLPRSATACYGCDVPRPRPAPAASAAACAAASRRGSRCCTTNDATIDRVAHHVVRLDALVDVHVRVVRPRVVLDRRSWMNWKPGSPTASYDEMVGAAGVADRQRGHPEVLERLHPRLEDRRDRFVPLQVDAADRAGAVVDVEVAGELRVLRLQLHRRRIAEVRLDVRRRAEQPLLLAAPQPDAHRAPQPDAAWPSGCRIASIMTAEPAALSVAPVPVCHESKCAPSITTSSALSVPGSSPTMLKALRSSS